jgi:hypothetical protein
MTVERSYFLSVETGGKVRQTVFDFWGDMPEGHVFHEVAKHSV